MADFTKTLEDIKAEILSLKQGGKVMSTMKSYYFSTQIILPADPSTPSGFFGNTTTYRLKITYKNPSQPVFSRIPVQFFLTNSDKSNSGSEAWRSSIIDGQQYVWVAANKAGDPHTVNFRMISTAEVSSVELALE